MRCFGIVGTDEVSRCSEQIHGLHLSNRHGCIGRLRRDVALHANPSGRDRMMAAVVARMTLFAVP